MSHLSVLLPIQEIESPSAKEKGPKVIFEAEDASESNSISFRQSELFINGSVQFAHPNSNDNTNPSSLSNIDAHKGSEPTESPTKKPAIKFQIVIPPIRLNECQNIVSERPEKTDRDGEPDILETSMSDIEIISRKPSDNNENTKPDNHESVAPLYKSAKLSPKARIVSFGSKTDRPQLLQTANKALATAKKSPSRLSEVRFSSSRKSQVELSGKDKKNKKLIESGLLWSISKASKNKIRRDRLTSSFIVPNENDEKTLRDSPSIVNRLSRMEETILYHEG